MAKIIASGGTPVAGVPWSSTTVTGTPYKRATPLTPRKTLSYDERARQVQQSKRAVMQAAKVSSPTTHKPKTTGVAPIRVRTSAPGVTPKTSEWVSSDMAYGQSYPQNVAAEKAYAASQQAAQQATVAPTNPYTAAKAAATNEPVVATGETNIPFKPVAGQSTAPIRSMEMTGAEIANMLRAGGVKVNTIASVTPNSNVGQASQNDPVAAYISPLAMVDPGDTIATMPPTMSQVMTGKEITELLSGAKETDITPPSQLRGKAMAPARTVVGGVNLPFKAIDLGGPNASNIDKLNSDARNAEIAGEIESDYIAKTSPKKAGVQQGEMRTMALEGGPNSFAWRYYWFWWGNPTEGGSSSIVDVPGVGTINLGGGRY